MMTDKDVLGSALTILKHQSHMYHALAEQTGNQAFLREVSSLMNEKLAQRLQVFQEMNQRGWYNPQLISEQQLQQKKSTVATDQQELQQLVQHQTSSVQGDYNQQWQPTSGFGTHISQGSQQHFQQQPQHTWGGPS